jgi:DNA-binding MarR family transcriptional regulator
LAVCAFSFLPSGLSADLPPEEPNNIFWKKENSPVYITQGNFEVLEGQTLTIEQGVIVYFDDGLGINVEGTLNALGTAGEPIQFTKIPGPTFVTPWRSLMFIDDEDSVLSHVGISMAYNGIHVRSSSLGVENTDIRGVRNSAVIVDSRSGPSSNPLFVNCSFGMGMGGYDLRISGDSYVTALNTTFEKTTLGDPSSFLERQWFLDVHVNNSLGENVEGSLVSVEDKENGTAILSQSTNSEGVASFVATEYIAHFGGTNYSTPHTITATKPGYEDVTLGSFWVDGSEIAGVMLEDLTAPSTTLFVSGPSHGMAPIYVGGTTTLSFLVSEGGTSPVLTQYNLDGTGWVVYDGAPFSLTGKPYHNISFYSTDPVPNTELSKSKMLYLDTTPPTLSYALDSEAEGTDPITVPTGTAVTLEATDEGSDVSYLRYSTEGGPYQDYSGPLIFQFDGFYNISYQAQDWIGNSAEDVLWLRVVSPPPPVVNNPPYFISDPSENGKVGETYYYMAIAFDPDYDDLTYSLSNPPDGMLVDPYNGLVTWTPAVGQEGRYQVRLVVSDGEDMDVQIFFIMVDKMDAPPSGDLFMVFAAIGIAVAIGASFMSFTEYGRYRFFLFFLVPLYSKLRKDQVLNQFFRGQIYGYIMAYPGENYSSIKRALNVGNGTLTHHLYILEREGFVTSRVDGRYKRFYPVGLKKEKRAKMSMIQKVLLKMIKQNPNMSQTEIAVTLETSKQVVNYHIKMLEKFGMIRIAKKGAKIEYEVLSRSGGS